MATWRVPACLLLLFAAPALSAQSLPPASQGLLGDGMIPLHTAPADPAGGAYGIWAAGPGYKASFHDGFSFYPALGPDAPEHLPLHWHTESVTVGGRSLVDRTPVVRYSPWRLERDHGAVIEAYDVRRDGVEQTFTLLRRPDVRGDLVISGRIETPLRAEPVADACQALVFRSGDEAILRYGEAKAFDAGGAEAIVRTGFDGERIRLTLDAAFLATAQFPVTVDPLTTPSIVSSATTNQPIGEIAIAAEAGTSSPKVLVAYTRSFTANDYDGFAIVSDSNFGARRPIFSDVATWDTRQISACAVGSTWALGLQRDFSPTNTQVRIYIHDVANPALNGGTTLFPSPPSGRTHANPAIGGSAFGERALLAFEQRTSTTSAVYGIRVQVRPQIGMQPAFSLYRSVLPVLADRRQPAVIPRTFSATPWIVAFVSVGRVSGGYSVGASLVNFDGTVTENTRTLATLPTGTNAGRPLVAGFHDRYLLTYGSWGATVLSGKLHAVRFDWPAGSAATVVATRTLINARLSGNDGLAHDMATNSHWALTYRTRDLSLNNLGWTARVGFRAGITESQSLDSTGTWKTTLTTVAFARPGSLGVFPIAQVFETPAAIQDIYGRQLNYPTDAIASLVGTSCGPGGLTSSSNRPYAGSEFFRVNFNGLAPNTLAFYVLGLVPDSTSLAPLGLPGCTRYVGNPILATFWALADGSGTATVSFALPDDPLFIGDAQSQWLWLAPGANPVGVLAYAGIRIQVR